MANNSPAYYEVHPMGNDLIREGSQIPTLDRPAIYRIKVPGRLDTNWCDWVGTMTVAVESQMGMPPVTVLTGALDQAGLHGLLRGLYARGLPLISVVCVDCQ